MSTLNTSNTTIVEWSSGSRGQLANWSMVVTDTVIFHEQYLQVQQALSETIDQALDITTYYGMQQVSVIVEIYDQNLNTHG